MPSTAKQIRDTKRLLARQTLSADARVELSRKLESLENVQSGTRLLKREEKLKDKYRYVRFVEATKIRRLISRLERGSSSVSEKDSDGEEAGPPPLGDARCNELAQLRIKLAYTEHFPKGLKYISLLRESREVRGAKDLQQRILDRMATALEKGELDKPGFSLSRADFFGDANSHVEEGSASLHKEYSEKEDLEGDDFFLP
ncbi:MAG: hypothetical protein SGCHY_003468 [Lobulomycetales sp.]